MTPDPTVPANGAGHPIVTDRLAPSWISLRVHNSSVAIARRFADDAIGAYVADPDLTHSIVLIVSELVTNALRAASTVRTWAHYERPVKLGVLATDEDVYLYVTDPDVRPIPPSGAAERVPVNGWGLGIVDALSEKRWVTHGEGGKTVHVLISTYRERGSVAAEGPGRLSTQRLPPSPGHR